jgi:hypothetical protein
MSDQHLSNDAAAPWLYLLMHLLDDGTKQLNVPCLVGPR